MADGKKGIGLGDVLGTISPLYGALSGQGLFSGLANLSPAILAARELSKKDKKPGEPEGMKRGGKVRKFAKGGAVRGDGCAQRGKTKGSFR